MGAEIGRAADGRWHVHGVGVGGLAEPAGVLDMGNSGTSTRLIAGLLASHPMIAFVTGDASLVKRPMDRVTVPLGRMGAGFVTRSGGRLPMAVTGSDRLVPITYALPVASAQVKSAVLLAGLNTAGETTVIERVPTRDYTETLLRHFGAEVRVAPAEDGGDAITVVGQPELTGRPVTVPGDISSAAFPIVAAAIRAGSDVVVENVGLNARRTGLLTTLEEMGADIAYLDRRMAAGEPVADLRIRGRGLSGVEVPAARAASMIDEYPILAIAAACADGPTRMDGVGELRVKESDRLEMTARGLRACGVAVEDGPDWMVVHGTGRAPAGGATVETALDHRIAMSFLVLGLAAEAPVGVDDARPIATSFPGFADLLATLGATIRPAEPDAA
ncbi:MAG: 3-phosphoshikimate 1-carboxyvinyltransferase, partial [Alphaproteobacteria bacterium]|jgi:3-phosphoshikimate 1-carboxyvinyltransferase|nr:3-phosphoshikimate 1-carboxyvinyltransferase [Alphaproteobacteria bacterium]